MHQRTPFALLGHRELARPHRQRHRWLPLFSDPSLALDSRCSQRPEPAPYKLDNLI